MSAVSRINHVSVNAKDLAVSVNFYVDVFGAEPLATPNFGLPVQWLEMGGRLSDASRGQSELSGLADAAVRQDGLGQGRRRRAHGRSRGRCDRSGRGRAVAGSNPVSPMCRKRWPGRYAARTSSETMVLPRVPLVA